MYDETKLEEDVLTWINSFTSIKVFVHAFAELSNGVALFRILNEVDEDIWKLKDVIIDDLNDKNIKYQNLTKVFEGLIHFYDEKLDIMVSNSFIDIEAISEIDEDFDGKANKSIDNKLMNKTLTKLCFTIHSTKAFSPSFNIAKSMTPRGLITKAPNVHDLLKLCEMVIDVTVKCDNKEIFIKQVQDLNEITQIGLMTCIQNIEHYLRKDQEIEEFSYSTLKEKHNPLFKMLTLNAKSIDNISLNQSFTSAEKLDRIIKDSLYDIKESTVEVNGFNLPLNSARTLDDSTEIIEINIDETKLKSRIQALEGQIKIYKSNQNEMSSRNKEMNEVIKKLLKDKKNFEKLKKKLSSKDSQAKLQAVCPETLKHIADIEADLEQKKTENSNLQKDNYNLRRKITEFEEMQQKDEEAGKMYSQELIQEIDSLKIKLATIQDVSIINEEYKAKVEELLEHKAKYDEIFNENESLRRQLFSNELIRNTEQRYQDLYKSLKEEHSNTKDLLTSAEIEIRKLKDETNDIKADLERVQTNNSKKDEIISQLRLDIEKCKLIQIKGLLTLNI